MKKAATDMTDEEARAAFPTKKDVREMSPAEFRQAMDRLGQSKPEPLKLPDARTLSDADWQRALRSI